MAPLRGGREMAVMLLWSSWSSWITCLCWFWQSQLCSKALVFQHSFTWASKPSRLQLVSTRMVYYLALRESPRVYKEILLISKEKSGRVVVLGDIQRAFSSSVVLRSSSIAASFSGSICTRPDWHIRMLKSFVEFNVWLKRESSSLCSNELADI